MRKIINILALTLISSLAVAQFNPGQIGNNQTLCYQSAPSTLAFTTAPSGGTAPYSYQWQRSADGGNTWLNITGLNGTRSTYAPPVLSRTAWFRCVVRDAASASGNTNTITITVSTLINAGTIGNSQTIYSGSVPQTIVETEAPSGGSGSFTFRWESSADGQTWTDIPGETASSYSPSALTTERWFRRWAVDGLCGAKAGNEVKIGIFNTITLYTTEIPVSDVNYHVDLDLGTTFSAISDGVITKVRLYKIHTFDYNELGLHHIRFWRYNSASDYELLLGPIDWNITADAAGWLEFDLPEPVAVTAGNNYIISITTGDGNNVWACTDVFTPVATNPYITYVNGIMTTTIGTVPDEHARNAQESFFRDVVFIPFSDGDAGTSQAICYNTVPAPLNETVAPSGGTGTFAFQWQSSPDGTVWSDISGATSASYAPAALTTTTYFRRVVTSGDFVANGSTKLIVVNPQFSLAQLGDDITIYENSGAFYNITLTGGTSPYTINYTLNGVPQTPLTGYISGTDLYTGTLASGTYLFALTGVSDAAGCAPESLGTSITISATMTNPSGTTNKALVVVNTGIINYPDYHIYVKPYLDWFGIPYDTCDVNSQTLPDLNNYAVVILGHKNLFGGAYPLTTLETAVYNGVGLYSFDPYIFDRESGFSIETGHQDAVTSGVINFNTSHFITEYHANDQYNPTNNSITLKFYYPSTQSTITLDTTSFTLNNAVDLATMSDGVNTTALLQVGTYGAGKVVRWTSHEWMLESYLGPVYGMDDLVWRSIVWAARKPFVMQGLPPMITMRVDDVNGTRTLDYLPDLEWMKICNEYGLIPWVGSLVEEMSEHVIDTLRDRINRGLATASPHALGYDNFIYYNVNGISGFNSRNNIEEAWAFFQSHNLPVSNYILPHWYLIDTMALNTLSSMGVEFFGNIISSRNYPFESIDYPGPWLQGGPYRINRSGTGHRGQPHFYAGYVNLDGNTFFNVLSEIGDDGGYEWFPNETDVQGTIARGVRHLRRALNGMFLPVLFTHEDQIRITPAGWRTMISGVVAGVAPYNPEFKSTDYAVKYLRAKVNIHITNVTDQPGIVNVTCSGINDLETKCYLFTEDAGVISQKLFSLPQVTSTTVPVTIGVQK